MNKYIFLLVVLVFTFACTKQKNNLSRNIASNENVELSKEVLIRHVQRIFKVQDETRNRKYKVINFPVMNARDVEMGLQFIEAITKYMEDEEFRQESFSIFQAMSQQNIDWLSKKKQKDNMRDLFLTAFNRQERDRIVNLCFSMPAQVGDYLTIASLMAKETLCRYIGLFYSEDEILKALEEFPAKPSGVLYDGQRGYHVYSNKLLQQQVQLITAAIHTDLHHFYELFMNSKDETKNKFRVNKDGTAEADKIEPFDLISSYGVYYIISKNIGIESYTNKAFDKIQISKMVQKGLANILHMKKDGMAQWQSLPNLTVLKNNNEFVVLCLNGLPTIGSSQVNDNVSWSLSRNGTDLIEIWSPQYKLTELSSNHISSVRLSCNDKMYKLEVEAIDAATVPGPKPFQLDRKQPLNALMTVSLVSEIERSSIKMVQNFARLLVGWQVIGDIESVDTRSFLETELAKADAYFPVMHSMDVNYFNIGTEKSLALKLRKTIKNSAGQKRQINLNILLPDSQNFQPVILKPHELAELLNIRFKKKPAPLFLMNNSCASEKTLFAWTLVFREALEVRKKTGLLKDMSAVSDFPHIIGSKRSFATASLVDIVSHSTFTFTSLEMLAQGKSVEEIVEFLKQPAEKSFIELAGNFFSGKPASVGDVSSADNEKGFEPVYILEHPELLSLGGFRLFVSGENIRGRNEY